MFNRLRKRISFSNVIAVMALFIALGGSAYAAGKNSVGTKQLKNNAVTAKKIKNNAVTTAKIKKASVTGSKVKLSSLGTVPSATKATTADSATTATTATNATNATTADSLSNQKSILVKLNGGETKTLVSNGSVSITAECVVNDVGTDFVNLYENTTQAGAVAGGSDDWSGGTTPTDFLNPDTPQGDRIFVENSVNTTGQTNVDSDIDEGWILGPDGKGITTNSEGIILGLNYLGSPCVVGGVFDLLG